MAKSPSKDVDGVARSLVADDAVLKSHCNAGELPVLLLTAAHLSGDLSLLRNEWAPTYVLSSYAGGLEASQEAEARALCFEKLSAFRDSGKPVPQRPSYDFLAAALQWTCGKDSEPLQPLLNEQFVFGEDDPQKPGWTKSQLAPNRDFHVLIVGAGVSGMLLAHRFKQAGVDFTIYEKNTEVGGTWWENDYPGCAVDINSFIYSYTFAQQVWPHYFAKRDEVFAYLNDCAKRFGLRDHVRFSTEVVAADWDSKRSCWSVRVRDANGERTVTANVVVSGVGQLNRPTWPKIPGREAFKGSSFHSARWAHDVDLKGKRVGVIGTGSSAVQFLPHVAEAASEVTLFVRTVPWLNPTPLLRKAVEPELKWLLESVPTYAQWHRLFTFAPQLIGFLDQATVDPTYPPTEKAISASNEFVRQALTAWVDSQIEDRPDLRPLLIPDAPPGSKRLPRDDGTWIATLKRPNVRALTTRIERITERGMQTSDGVEHEFDVIVYGTGFKASEFLMPMQVTGLDGRDLHRWWDGDARAYLGSTITGFPNLFCLYGPNTNLVLHGASIVYISECAANYVVDAVRAMLEGDLDAIDVKADVYDQYNVRLDQANALRAWGFSAVNSWYKNAKGRVTQNWPFTGLELWRRTRQINLNDYTANPLASDFGSAEQQPMATSASVD
ncbi:flavin-containing monooxygenase [Nevskia ramosa]|uniref:flavin-containing monooxygenase n=1 Tax=Nevskia ramosa TaxID=64002 RepID=UPI002355C510|nr:NAD(P)/FAD-dependent oxidoreductase [Nevskia ramosa]